MLAAASAGAWGRGPGEWGRRRREAAGGIRGAIGGSRGARPPDDLRRHLRERLPEYLVPSALRAPRGAAAVTPNGKLDRRALPAPELTGAGGRGASADARRRGDDPGIWRQVLGDGAARACGRTSSDLGRPLPPGHAGRCRRIREAFGVELPLRALFEATLRRRSSRSASRSCSGGARVHAPPLVRAVPRDRPLPALLRAAAPLGIPLAGRVRPGHLQLPHRLRAAARRASTSARSGAQPQRRRAPRDAAHHLHRRSTGRCRWSAANATGAAQSMSPGGGKPRDASGYGWPTGAPPPFDLERGPLMRATLFPCPGRGPTTTRPCTTPSPTAGRWASSPAS